MTALIFYVDDIIVIGDDLEEMEQLKRHLIVKFEIKDLGKLKYFLGIKVAHSRKVPLYHKSMLLIFLLKLGC